MVNFRSSTRILVPSTLQLERKYLSKKFNGYIGELYLRDD